MAGCYTKRSDKRYIEARLKVEDMFVFCKFDRHRRHRIDWDYTADEI